MCSDAPLRPEGRLVLVDSGHFIQIDRPEVVVAVLSVAAPALTQWSVLPDLATKSP
jgi:hypothetical protein